eukprot:2258397-Pyramimonas_sp.AAC.1
MSSLWEIRSQVHPRVRRSAQASLVSSMTKTLFLWQVAPLSLLPPGLSAIRQSDEGIAPPCPLQDKEEALATSASI